MLTGTLGLRAYRCNLRAIHRSAEISADGVPAYAVSATLSERGVANRRSFNQIIEKRPDAGGQDPVVSRSPKPLGGLLAALPPLTRGCPFQYGCQR